MKRKADKLQRETEMAKRFKPCPFCGGRDLDVQINGENTDWVRCLDCDCTGPTSNGEDNAIQKWNQRE